MAGSGRAHLVGKLPSLAEYVDRLDGEEPERTFGDVLDRAGGYAAHEGGARWCAAYDGGGALGFLFRPSMRAPRAILGTMTPSQDSVGRRYPLMAVATLTDDVLSPGMAFLPAAASSFLGGLGSALRDARATGRADVAAQALAQLAAPEPADVKRTADDFARWIETPGLVPKLWKSLFPRGRAEDALAAMQAVSRFGGYVHLGAGECRYIRCPLGRGGGAAASFWLSALMRAAGGDEMISSAFWSLEGDGTLFVVFARQPPIDFWLRLWMDDRRDTVGATIDGEPPASALAAAIRSKDARINDVLERLSAGGS